MSRTQTWNSLRLRQSLRAGTQYLREARWPLTPVSYFACCYNKNLAQAAQGRAGWSCLTGGGNGLLGKAGLGATSGSWRAAAAVRQHARDAGAQLADSLLANLQPQPV